MLEAVNRTATHFWRSVKSAKGLVGSGVGIIALILWMTLGPQAQASPVRSEPAGGAISNDAGPFSEHEYHWSATDEPLLECHEAVTLAMQDPAQGTREREKLEAHLLEEGSDIDARIRVIGLYYPAQDHALKRRRATHLHWLIANHPEIDLSGYGLLDPGTEDYEEATRLWSAALKKNQGNLAVLRNAGDAFVRGHPELALEAFAKGAAADPAEADWHSELARAWQSSVKPDQDAGERRRRQHAALQERELALSLATGDFEALRARVEVARAAVAAEDFSRAREAATQALADAPRSKGIYVYGNALHWGHIVLGQVALAAGDVPGAVAELAMAGRTPGSPQLNSYGPDLELAAKLVQAGQRQAVTDYLRDCGKFWTDHDQVIGEWIAAIQHGDRPDFDGCH